MKTIAVLELDLATTPIGTRSRAGDLLAGVPVVRRTVERLQRAKRLEGIHVLAPAEQVSAAKDLLDGTGAQVHPQAGVPSAHASYTRLARKWSLDSWRGGIGGSAAMDEYLYAPAAAALAKAEFADAVFSISAAAPLVDPELADLMIAHAERIAQDMRLTFTAAPPGLAGAVFQASLLEELAAAGVPPSWPLRYNPDSPSPDLMFRPCCYHGLEAVRHSQGRLIADTRRSMERIERCLAAGADRGAESIGRWLMADVDEHGDDLPREVELELTTEDQLAGTILRPRGGLVGRRGPLPIECVQRLATELAAYDDSLVVVGGFGEPLLHRQWPEALSALRAAGVYGLALRTNGIALDEAAVSSILDQQVDVVEVTVDAVTEQTYAKVNGGGSLALVLENVERLLAARAARGQTAPLVVPQMTKCWETLDELDAFYDGWLRKVGWATVTGYSTYGGRMPDRSVVDMSPPIRQACRRIQNRCMVAADGKVLLCDQDFAAERPAGHLEMANLSEIWNGAVFTAARQAHRAGQFDAVSLCGKCQEWHRP